MEGNCSFVAMRSLAMRSASWVGCKIFKYDDVQGCEPKQTGGIAFFDLGRIFIFHSYARENEVDE